MGAKMERANAALVKVESWKYEEMVEKCPVSPEMEAKKMRCYHALNIDASI